MGGPTTLINAETGRVTYLEIPFPLSKAATEIVKETIAKLQKNEGCPVSATSRAEKATGRDHTWFGVLGDYRQSDIGQRLEDQLAVPLTAMLETEPKATRRTDRGELSSMIWPVKGKNQAELACNLIKAASFEYRACFTVQPVDQKPMMESPYIDVQCTRIPSGERQLRNFIGGFPRSINERTCPLFVTTADAEPTLWLQDLLRSPRIPSEAVCAAADPLDALLGESRPIFLDDALRGRGGAGTAPVQR